MLTEKEKEIIIESFCKEGVLEITGYAFAIWDEEKRDFVADGRCCLEEHYRSCDRFQMHRVGRVDKLAAMDFITRLHKEKEQAYKAYFLDTAFNVEDHGRSSKKITEDGNCPTCGQECYDLPSMNVRSCMNPKCDYKGVLKD